MNTILIGVSSGIAAFKALDVGTDKTDIALAPLCSRGLATTVLSMTVISAGIVTMPAFAGLAFMLIFMSNVAATLGAYFYEKYA